MISIPYPFLYHRVYNEYDIIYDFHHLYDFQIPIFYIIIINIIVKRITNQT